MDDRITEIRKALAAWDAIPAVDVPSEAQPYAAVFVAARKWLALLESDALIIRRVDYEAALAACSEVWPWSRVSMADIEVVVDAALTDLLDFEVEGVEPQ